jgi:hypothetical protein
MVDCLLKDISYNTSYSSSWNFGWRKTYQVEKITSMINSYLLISFCLPRRGPFVKTFLIHVLAYTNSFLSKFLDYSFVKTET